MRLTAADLIERNAGVLFTFNADNRITGVNQWDGGQPPEFYLARSLSSVVYRVSADLAEDVVDELQLLAATEAPLGEDLQQLPRHHERYQELLNKRDSDFWHGPVYGFPVDIIGSTNSVVAIDEDNRSLLDKFMPDWLPDVGQRSPFYAAVVDDHAVAVCASARSTTLVCAAGVETAEDYRRQGHAANVVCAWAKRVRGSGREPIYSTSWSNLASQAVARHLDLRCAGAEYHL